MTDSQTRVFISYSRADLAFAEALRQRLIGDGLEAFIDVEDVVKGEEWRKRLQGLIESADVVVFLISPDSVASEVCDWEINEAERVGKRICPAVARATPLEDVPPRLTRLNFTFLDDPATAESEYPKLLEAIRQDAAWVREHSRLGEQALRWDRAGRPSRLLLRGADIATAEGWRAERTPTAPELTALHNAYLDASRRGATRRLRSWVAGSALVALVTAGLAVFAVIQQRLAVANEARAVEAADDAERQRQAAVASAEEADRQRRAAVAAQEEAEESEALTRAAVDSVIFEIAQGLRDIEGVSPAAIRRILGQVDETTATLLARDPENAGLRRSRSVMLSEFGDVYLRTGDVERAAAAYEESLAIDRALAEAEPENTGYRRDVSVSLERIGDLRLRRGEAAAALAAYEESLVVARALAEAEPENTGYRRDVSVSLDRIGDLRLRRGEAEAALAAYEESLVIRRALAEAEPENTGYRRDVSVSLNKIGDLRLRRGEAAAALAAYEESLVIMRALAEAEPENTLYRRDVSVSLNKIGDLRLRRGEAAAALAAYEESLVIRRALAEAEPENTLFQRDVSVSLNKVGDLRLRSGEAEATLAAYEESLVIRRALAEAEPENVQAQTDVVISLMKLYFATEGTRAEAALREAYARVLELEARGVLAADQQEWRAFMEQRLQAFGGP